MGSKEYAARAADCHRFGGGRVIPAAGSISVELKNGCNVLRFKRYSEGQLKGITIKDIKLVPWERREIGRS